MSIKFPCPYPPPNPAPPGCEFYYGDPPYQLFGDPQLAGGFQWVSYECASSANSIEDYLRMTKTSNLVMADKSNTYYNPLNPTQYNTPPPSPNPWICSSPGVQPNNNISAALDCWLFQDAPGCWLPPGPPKPEHRNWTVPVYNQTNELTGANAKYHVVMFAEFEFLGYWFANNQCNSGIDPKEIERIFRRQIAFHIGSGGRAIVVSVNRGVPLILEQPNHLFSLQVKQIAEFLTRSLIKMPI